MKKLKLCTKTPINDSSASIVIPSSTPKENEAVMWSLEDGQVVNENLDLSNIQMQVGETFKETNTATAELPEDDATSACSSSMSSSVSQSFTVPLPDHCYNKKKVAMEKVHSVIESTAAKLSFACDSICANLTQSERIPTASIEEDPAVALIKNGLKKVPSKNQFKCLSEIMAVLDKYSSNVPENTLTMFTS